MPGLNPGVVCLHSIASLDYVDTVSRVISRGGKNDAVNASHVVLSKLSKHG